MDNGAKKEKNAKSEESNAEKANSKADDAQSTLKMVVQCYSYVVLHFLLNFAVSNFILFISFYIYPGGD